MYISSGVHVSHQYAMSQIAKTDLLYDIDTNVHTNINLPTKVLYFTEYHGSYLCKFIF